MNKKRGREPKLANCSSEDVFRALRKLGDFSIMQGAKHTVILHQSTKEKSTTPRSFPINRYLLKDFIEDYLIDKIGFSKTEIYKYLWC